VVDIAVLLSVGRHAASGRARRADLDARALELALGLADTARVHAIHAGDPQEPALREYLGMGIGRLTVLPATGCDVAPVLTHHLRALRPAVVLAGQCAENGEASGMLPYLIAQALGSQLVAGAVSITLRGDAARVVQALPRGARRALRIALPVTLTLDRAGPEARMSAFAPARRGQIQVAEADPSATGPAMPSDWRRQPARARPRRLRTLVAASAAERLRSIQPMRASAGTRLVDVDAEQAARAIWQYLLDQALVDAVAGSEAPAAMVVAGHAERGSA